MKKKLIFYLLASLLILAAMGVLLWLGLSLL